MAKLVLCLCLLQLWMVLAIGDKGPAGQIQSYRTPPVAQQLAQASTEIAKHAVVLRKLSQELQQHADIAPPNKSVALHKLAEKLKRQAKQKERTAVTIVKKNSPQSVKVLTTLKQAAPPSVKAVIKHMIQKATQHIRLASSKQVQQEISVDHKRETKIAQEAVKVLKNMKKRGEAVPPKQAKLLVKKILASPKATQLATSVISDTGMGPLAQQLAEESIQIARHAAVLRSVSEELKKHANIASPQKRAIFDKLAKKLKRQAKQKERSAVTIVKKNLPHSVNILKSLKQTAPPAIKSVIKRTILKAGQNIRLSSSKQVQKEIGVNHKRATKVAKKAVKVLKTMKKKGEPLPPKTAQLMVKKILARPNDTAVKAFTVATPIRKRQCFAGVVVKKGKTLKKMVKVMQKSLLKLMKIPNKPMQEQPKPIKI